MDGITDESVVKVGDVEMLEKPNFDETPFSEANGSDFGTPSVAIPSDGGATAISSTGSGTGTPTVGDDDGSDFRFSQGSRGGFR